MQAAPSLSPTCPGIGHEIIRQPDRIPLAALGRARGGENDIGFAFIIHRILDRRPQRALAVLLDKLDEGADAVAFLGIGKLDHLTQSAKPKNSGDIAGLPFFSS